MYVATISDDGNLLLAQVDDAGQVLIRPPEGDDPGDETARRDETCWGILPWGPSDAGRKQSRATEYLHAKGWRTIGDWDTTGPAPIIQVAQR